MSDMDKHEFLAGVKAVSARFNRPVSSKETLRLWYEDLKGYTPETYAEALMVLAREEKFFPDNFPFAVRKYARAIAERKREEKEACERDDLYKLLKKCLRCRSKPRPEQIYLPGFLPGFSL